jgi:hypothetical protein
MKAFGWSYHHVRYGMTGAEGWVWYNFAMEDTIGAWGPVYRRVGDGYVRQETKRLIRIANEHYERDRKDKKK